MIFLFYYICNMNNKTNIERKLNKFNELSKHIVKILGFPSALMANPEKTMLVIRDYTSAIMYAKTCKVIYITDNQELYEQFNKEVVGQDLFGKTDKTILVNESDWSKLNWFPIDEQGNKMKFDVAIMNPPYDRNLHLTILEQVIPLADKVVNISPVRWLQDPFAKYKKNSDYNKFENTISKKIESIDIIDAKTASTIFNAGFTMNLGIYLCGKGGYNYDMETPLIKKIIKKTMEQSWTPYSMQEFHKNGAIVKKPFVLEISGITGGKFPLMCSTYESQCNYKPKEKQIQHYISGKTKGATHFEFDTENERKNFYDAYNHRFMIWYCKLWKVDPNIRDYKVPYFGDYTKPWTSKMFCDYFNITGYIDDEHAEPGSEWEFILNDMKK